MADRIRGAEPTHVEFTTAEDGSVVGVLGDGLRLASMHQPRGEASRFADQLDVAETAFAAILGFGLGYHVQAVVERLRGTGVVTVFEPDPGLLRTVLSRIDCTGWLDPARVRIVCDEADGRQLGAAWSDLESQMVAGTRILEHPASAGRLAGRTQAFSSRLADAIGRARMTVSTELMRSVGTVRNELGNLGRYASGSGIGDLAGVARGRLGVVVSAGPSLQKNLHLLADEGIRSRCVVISAQTTLRPLLEAGVRPDFVTALDYHQISRRFYEGITASDVEGVTLVALPQAHPVIADCWPGTVRWCRALVLEEVLGEDAPGLAALPAASTVAHLSYHLARHLGCDPVALVGQDLGFTDGVYYSRGTAIDDVWSTELNPFNTLAMMEWQRIVRHKGMLHRLRDVHDRPILTDDQMLSYLRQFEAFFTRDRQRGLTTLDATEGGVRKAGTESCTLREALDAHADRGRGLLSLPAVVPRPGPPRSALVRRIEAFSAQVARLGV
ncbi:MAG: 6-hydroxymethylpterin diphosphokinase MptE-like protein, partial [Planctomycetota bacterium]|nr:6-hydroxymethylpterin diphosphokinase MptE-like protein [Planctomycetota bacterium]